VLRIVKLWQALSRVGGEFEVVGQVDYTDPADGLLHVGDVDPSGEMDASPARHLLRSVYPLLLLILCSHGAFGVLECLSGAPVGSNVDGHYILSWLNGGGEPSAEAAAVAAVLAGRSGSRDFALGEAPEKPAWEE
jgi:hypothetical protein